MLNKAIQKEILKLTLLTGVLIGYYLGILIVFLKLNIFLWFKVFVIVYHTIISVAFMQLLLEKWYHITELHKWKLTRTK